MRTGIHMLLPPDVDHAMALRFNAADESTSYPLPPQAANRRPGDQHHHRSAKTCSAKSTRSASRSVCPLIVDRRADRDPGAGASSWPPAEPALLAIQDAVEVLAAQAALALERIALTEAANRRDSDEYLRAVVQNTADVVVIIDEDQRIRYASPSAAAHGPRHRPAAGRHAPRHRPPGRPGPGVATLTAAERLRDDAGARDVWSLRRPDGSSAGSSSRSVSYRDLRHDRIVRGIVVTMRDITEERNSASRARPSAAPSTPPRPARTAAASRESSVAAARARRAPEPRCSRRNPERAPAPPSPAPPNLGKPCPRTPPTGRPRRPSTTPAPEATTPGGNGHRRPLTAQLRGSRGHDRPRDHRLRGNSGLDRPTRPQLAGSCGHRSVSGHNSGRDCYVVGGGEHDREEFPVDGTRVAVGTALAGGPPHRSQRAGLPHWAPALGSGVEAHVREGMHHAGGW